MYVVRNKDNHPADCTFTAARDTGLTFLKCVMDEVQALTCEPHNSIDYFFMFLTGSFSLEQWNEAYLVIICIVVHSVISIIIHLTSRDE